MNDRIQEAIHSADLAFEAKPRGKLRRLWDNLTRPRAIDEDEARHEYMTRVILLLMAIVMSISTVPVLLGWVLGTYENADAGIMLVSDAVIFVGFLLTHRWDWRPGSYIPSITFFILASLITYNAGVYTTGMLFYVVAILLSAILIGVRAQFIMAALSVGAYLLFGWINDPESLSFLPTIAIIVSSCFAGIALLQWLLISLLQSALKRSRLYSEKLEQRSSELTGVNIKLQQEVGERQRAESLLRESEKRYRTLFERAPIGLGVADSKGKLIDFNAAMLRPGGYTQEDGAAIKNVAELYYDPVEREKALSIAREQGFLHQYEVRFKGKDGNPYTSLLSLTPVEIDGRQCWQAMVEDITERKRAQEELLAVHRALKVLSSCNQAVIRASNEFELLQEVCKIITEEGSYHFAWVGYGEQDQKETIRSFPQAGFEAGYLEKLPLSDSGNSRTDQGAPPIQTGRLLISKRIETDPHLIRRRLEALTREYTSSISLPLEAGDKSVGSLNIYSEEADTFRPEEVALLQKLADNLAFGIATLRTRTQHLEAKERIQRQLVSMSALRTIDMTITASLDLRFTFDVILAQITSTLEADAATILVYQPRAQTLDYVAGRGFRTNALQHTHLRLGQGIAGRVALERDIIHIPRLNETDTSLKSSPRLLEEDFVEYLGAPLMAKGQIKGVLEIFNRSTLTLDQEWMDLLKAMAAQAAIAIDNAELFRDLQQSNQEILMAYEFTLEGWAKTLELRDGETQGHTERVTDMTLRLARAMEIDEEWLVHVRRGSRLHDIGKMGIPDSILLKPGPLTDEEWETMRRHPVYAYELLSPIPYLRPALDIPYCHHEKWDGTGYPRGLKGEQIPLAARIFAVVDVWDALRSDRPYRGAWPEEKVKQYLQEQVGKHFDPQVVEAFLKLI